MLTQVIDPVAVMDTSVRALLVSGSQTIFHHHNRQLIALIDLIQRITQAIRVYLPAPLRSGQIRIFRAARQVACHLFRILVGRDTGGHVVGTSVEVYGSLFQNLFFFLCDLQIDPIFPEISIHIGRIRAADLHVGTEPVQHIVMLLGRQDILRITGQRVGGQEHIHIA